MKKILFLRSNPVDPDSRVEKEVQCLLEAGYKVDILGWDRRENYKIRKQKLSLGGYSATIYRVGIKAVFGNGIKNLRPNLQFQRALKKFLTIHKSEYDFIHACDFDTAYTAFHNYDRKHTKFIYDIFDFYVDAFHIPSKAKPLVLKMDRNIIDNADAVIICTEQRKEQIAGTSPKNLTIIHNAPPIFEYNENSGRVFDGKLRIAYFGILSETGRLIKELVRTVSNNSNYELYIGGFGALEEFVKEAATDYSNIKYFGKVPYTKVLAYESKCDLITALYDPTVTNHIYAAPNKFYEALMLGKPLIMCKGTGMSNVVAEHDFGWLIDYNYESLNNGLEYIFSNYQYFSEHCEEEISLYKEKYNWETMKSRLIGLYTKLSEE